MVRNYLKVIRVYPSKADERPHFDILATVFFDDRNDEDTARAISQASALCKSPGTARDYLVAWRTPPEAASSPLRSVTRYVTGGCLRHAQSPCPKSTGRCDAHSTVR